MKSFAKRSNSSEPFYDGDVRRPSGNFLSMTEPCEIVMRQHGDNFSHTSARRWPSLKSSFKSLAERSKINKYLYNDDLSNENEIRGFENQEHLLEKQQHLLAAGGQPASRESSRTRYCDRHGNRWTTLCCDTGCTVSAMPEDMVEKDTVETRDGPERTVVRRCTKVLCCKAC